MRPTLRQIEYFVAVAEYGAFGAAAKALAVSQPSLSKQVSTMEEELGTRLFERTSRRVTLTPTGRAVLVRGRSILQEVRDFRAVARGTTSLFAAKLSIGVLPSVGAYFMPSANRRLHTLYPDLRLVVQEGATRQLLDLLKDGKIDAVIGAPTNDPEFESASLFEETLWVCAASDDPLSSGSGPVTLSDLADRPLLSLSAGFSLHDLVKQLAAKAGTYLSLDYEGGSLDAVRQMAVMGAGVAILPSLYALAEAVRDPEFKVRRLDHPDAFHPIALHWRRTSPAAEDFHSLAADLVSVKEEIRAIRGDRFG
ncbi:LysR family transcriptional regulator [Roseovarius sp. LXJ103]|uniref:hydrogen peroxide-inducible genes activator n=1 Tax=Roseovarius carneus TaxID=2853164 RepID=UPI000D6057CB|nr:hydrogen peroxide-inducible genes activator [Roseovarius carneus]MBZ8117629.1 LysR family transcriptional regulator [Roseovarius carneus]PWE36586.1 hydrogen peroxide-inducible genes activator [Pelagicola sp. LXJ1103]